MTEGDSRNLLPSFGTTRTYVSVVMMILHSIDHTSNVCNSSIGLRTYQVEEQSQLAWIEVILNGPKSDRRMRRGAKMGGSFRETGKQL